MFDLGSSSSPPLTIRQVADTFRWVGWSALTAQALLGAMPIFILVFALFFHRNPPQTYFNLSVTLAYACLVILLFSLYWCYRYTRLAIQLVDPQRRPSKVRVIQQLWAGLVVNLVGISCATIIGISQTGNLLVRLLSLPPGSRVVTQNPDSMVLSPYSLINPMNMIALQADFFCIAAATVGVVAALWLLNRVDRHTAPSSLVIKGMEE
ncbi:DUF3611 family protein [Pantanalinema rosaneae CENA516]|uniref:DUF3611 family protein n=1 Tax=Pantanalinema rosaneae TaxID=1620701 RepID=UPI003D6DE709